MRSLVEIAGEGPIELEVVEWQSHKVAKRGVACAEVVQGEADANFPDSRKNLYNLFKVMGQYALGQFNVQILTT
ncbi:hypothetical protein D9M71_458700 [compost metagenome]